MKLYKRYSKIAYNRRLSKRQQENLKWALSLKPGDIINDCSGFNSIIKEVIPDVRQTKRGWFIYNVDFIVEPFGGSCSLVHCGIEPALTPEQIENRIREFYDWCEPHGGWGIKTEKDPTWTRLQQGLPICDERGLKIR